MARNENIPAQILEWCGKLGRTPAKQCQQK